MSIFLFAHGSLFRAEGALRVDRSLSPSKPCLIEHANHAARRSVKCSRDLQIGATQVSTLKEWSSHFIEPRVGI